MLYCHPESKFFNEPPKMRLKLILENFLEDPTLDLLKVYKATIAKIDTSLLTKAQRSLTV